MITTSCCCLTSCSPSESDFGADIRPLDPDLDDLTLVGIGNNCEVDCSFGVSCCKGVNPTRGVGIDDLGGAKRSGFSDLQVS